MSKAQDNFFAPIGNTKPYFKAAFEGFAGTGKTYTTARVAIGLYKRIGSKKPVIIFDTEKAAKFLKSMFAAEGIEVLIRESRSLADLKETMTRMRHGASDLLIIDSISHVWEDFLKSYAEKVRRTRLEFQDWGVIKPTWKTEFSDPFVRDPYHIIMTGRAGYEYENEINKETGKREIYKSGVKMKVEGETAYEPDLLVLMERMQEMEGGSIKKVTRQGIVIKDRSTVIDGKVFENPDYKDFAPAIDVMLESPELLQTTAERDAGSLFRTEEEKYEWKQMKKRWLEEIENYLVSVWPGQAAGYDVDQDGAVEPNENDITEWQYQELTELVKSFTNNPDTAFVLDPKNIILHGDIADYKEKPEIVRTELLKRLFPVEPGNKEAIKTQIISLLNQL